MKGETILSFALAALATAVHGAPLQGRHIEARYPFVEPVKDFEVFEAREAYVNTGKTLEFSERNSFVEKRADSTASATATVATTPADLPGCPPGTRRRAAPLGCDPTKPQTGSAATSAAAAQGTGANTVAKLRGFKASKNSTNTAGRATASGKAKKNKGTATLPSATAIAAANAASAGNSTTTDGRDNQTGNNVDSQAGETGAGVKARSPTPTAGEKRSSPLDALTGGSTGGVTDLLSSLTGDASSAAGTSTAGGASDLLSSLTGAAGGSTEGGASDLLSSLTGDATGAAGGSTAGGASDLLSGLTGSLVK